QEIKEKIEEFKTIKPVQNKGNYTDVKNLRFQIEKLEEKMETEALSFDKERKLNDVIKQKKKELKEVGASSENFDKARGLSKDIEVVKKKADEKHKEIQDKAKKSQELHLQILEISKEVDGLKTKRDTAQNKFLELKKKFVQLNNKLKVNISVVREKLKRNKKEKKVKESKKEKEIVKEKSEEVKEKLKKKGVKLTTEDLLVMQQMKDEDISFNIDVVVDKKDSK
ncbi:MAG: hypothetical protein KAQ83_01825, partial [Nanoarchaeota archaeon]|nr:hypothetical protein [Nanoarchaeota archaeon]